MILMMYTLLFLETCTIFYVSYQGATGATVPRLDSICRYKTKPPLP
jgi:hypothetical protein